MGFTFPGTRSGHALPVHWIIFFRSQMQEMKSYIQYSKGQEQLWVLYEPLPSDVQGRFSDLWGSLHIQNRVLGKGCGEAIGKEKEPSSRESRRWWFSESCFLAPGEVFQESAALTQILHLVTALPGIQDISIVGLDVNWGHCSWVRSSYSSVDIINGVPGDQRGELFLNS